MKRLYLFLTTSKLLHLQGFQVVHLTFNQFEFLLDCVAFLTNYTESSDGLEILNHNTSAICNIRSFLRFTSSNRTFSEYVFTININDMNTSATRGSWKHESMRLNAISADYYTFIGIFSSRRTHSTNLPLIDFHKLLRSEPKNSPQLICLILFVWIGCYPIMLLRAIFEVYCDAFSTASRSRKKRRFLVPSSLLR